MLMKYEIQNRLAENMKRLRKERKLTQFELAEKANISEAMVKSIELMHAYDRVKLHCGESKATLSAFPPSTVLHFKKTAGVR